MTKVDHLSQAAQKALRLPDDQRIERISGARWIGYTRAQEILTKLGDLLTYPRQPRMPNLLLYGATGNGKTMIINRFLARHPADDNPEGEAAVVPVLAVQAPPLPSERRLYDAILEALFAPYKPRDHVSKKQFQVLRILRGRSGYPGGSATGEPLLSRGVACVAHGAGVSQASGQLRADVASATPIPTRQRSSGHQAAGDDRGHYR